MPGWRTPSPVPARSASDLLTDWQNAPAARACHPREKHLLPLLVVAGAAGNEAATLPMRGMAMRTHALSVRFG